MTSFFRFFAERHILANVITLMLLLLGIAAIPNINRDSFPEVDLGEVYITTRYPGAGPEEVELFVTNKIEKEIKGIDGIEFFTSTSVEETSTVYIKIDIDNKDPDEVKDKIREAVDRVSDFPPEVDEQPQILEIESSTFPILEVGLSGDIPYDELMTYAKRFEKKLENVRGVSSLQKFGYLAREVRVEAKSDKLDKYQISLAQLIGAVRNRNVRATMGTIEDGSNRTIFANAQYEVPEQVGDVIVRSNFEGRTVRVKDLAIIRPGFEEARTESRLNGASAISFKVLKSENTDVLTTVQRINKLIEEEKLNLPGSVDVVLLHDFSKYLKNRLKVMISNGIMGLCLILIVLGLFLNVRLAFWVALGIPVSVLGSLFLLNLFGETINVVSLMALIIVIGIIVDDAIIVAENIVQMREKGLSPLDAAVAGIHRVFKPVLTTIITTFLAFAPMYFMKGIMGKFIYVIPLVVTFALIVSLIEVTLALPAHMVGGLKHIDDGNGHQNPLRRGVNRLIGGLRRRYKRALMFCLRWRYSTIIFFNVFLVAITFTAVNVLDFELFPESSADQFFVQVEMPANFDLDQTREKVMKVENVILSLDQNELLGFSTRVGMAGNNYEFREKENEGIIVVDLKPTGQRLRVAREVVNELRAKTKALNDPDITVRFTVDGGGPPVGAPITLRVIGADDTLRNKLADDAFAFISSLEGAQDIERNDKLEPDNLRLHLNYQKLSRLGINLQDVVQTIRSAYTGVIATQVRYGEDDVDFRVILEENERKSPNILRTLLIPNNTGRLVPLQSFAKFYNQSGNKNYYHYDGERSITISGDLDKSITSSTEVNNKIVEHFDLAKDYPGMSFEIGGEGKESEESFQDLMVTFVIAILGIYFLLLILFNSVIQPFLVIAAIPFGLIGVFIAFMLHNEPLSFIAVIGTIGLSGVVVNDSLVMVNHINMLRKENPDKTSFEMIVEGSADRLRPIMLTSLTTVVGLLPLAYGFLGSDPFIAPMGLALGWGLVFSTPLTLLILPSFYLVSLDLRAKLKKVPVIKHIIPE